MICLSTMFLKKIGLTTEVLEEMRRTDDGGGLAISPLENFGGGGNRGRDKRALEAEPAPRRLLLVGMRDAYGEAERLGAEVTELCWSEDRGVHQPTVGDIDDILAVLQGADSPNAEPIRAALTAYRAKI